MVIGYNGVSRKIDWSIALAASKIKLTRNPQSIITKIRVLIAILAEAAIGVLNINQ